MKQGILSKYIGTPILSLLKQGLTPGRLALSMASGIAIGLCPLVGTTTAICTMSAILFRMNLLAIQLGNWLVFPLEIMLIVPFIVMGGHLFGTISALNPSQIAAMLQSDLWAAVRLFARAILHAGIAWAICAPFVFAASYAVLFLIFRHVQARLGNKRSAP